MKRIHLGKSFVLDSQQDFGKARVRTQFSEFRNLYWPTSPFGIKPNLLTLALRTHFWSSQLWPAHYTIMCTDKLPSTTSIIITSFLLFSFSPFSTLYSSCNLSSNFRYSSYRRTQCFSNSFIAVCKFITYSLSLICFIYVFPTMPKKMIKLLCQQR